MASRITLILFVSAMFPAGCGRKEAPPQVAVTAPAADKPKGDRLATPVVLEVNGHPLTSDDRNLHPLLGDFDGDGVQDLLVGTDVSYTSGRLSIYRNIGTKDNPRFSGPQWFDDLEPTGRIPIG